MPNKRNPDSTYGEKLIGLFARLLFSGEWLTLPQLAREFDCSKQTILRLVRDIEQGYRVPIQTELRGHRRYFRIPRRKPSQPAAMLSRQEVESLLMCRAFTQHLLGPAGFTAARRALEKTSQLVADDDLDAAEAPDFGVFRPGSIDYAPFQDTLRTLTEAMHEGRVCEVEYRKPGNGHAERMRIKPLKIFAWRETIYVHSRYAKMPGETYRDPGYDPLLALQRFQHVTKTDTPFRRPQDYDFERSLNRHFGLYRGKPFRVTAEFSGWAADYVAEREWSPDQNVEPLKNGKLKLSFDAVSLPEVVTWVIGFGDLCRVIAPDDVIRAVRDRIDEVGRLYT